MSASEPSLPARLSLRLPDFAHPSDVAAAADLSPGEKRRILACWASDAHVPESRPGLRWLPGTPGPVPLQSILSALRDIDRQSAAQQVMADFAARRRPGPEHRPTG